MKFQTLVLVFASVLSFPSFARTVSTSVYNLECQASVQTVDGAIDQETQGFLDGTLITRRPYGYSNQDWLMLSGFEFSAVYLEPSRFAPVVRLNLEIRQSSSNTLAFEQFTISNAKDVKYQISRRTRLGTLTLTCQFN